ncbi:nickel-responsive transcriptional regulator NikR [candidate division CSSED10-310 bacterium]|uniref:Putative nickel-responsive regulator n=1 Tax=candidate division CSSED10-310 bacterium TaxID=2855610 RepID=A0ABV6YR53_UNCC1
MPDLARFSVSLAKNLLDKFDQHIQAEQYPTRSKAVEDLIRLCLIKKEWAQGDEVAGAVLIVYDHHKPNLAAKLTRIQHDYHHTIISTQHIHLDHDNCLEIIVVKGKPEEVETLAQRLKTMKGVKHGSLTMTTTGKGV